MKISGEIIFGKCVIPPSQIFLLRKNVYAMINHKPFSPGHVLVCSRREVPKLQDLTEVETIDLFMTAHEVCRKLQKIYKIEMAETQVKQSLIAICISSPRKRRTKEALNAKMDYLPALKKTWLERLIPTGAALSKVQFDL